MTTLCTVELVCPVCDRAFESRTVLATDSLGGKRTDFHERANGAQPLPYFVHTCCRCGFTSLERDFAGDVEVTPTLRSHVWNELAPRVDKSLLTGSEKYEAAAKVAMWQGRDAEDVGDMLLRAAWCCVDEDDIEAERYFRREAVSAFERALCTWNGIRGEKRAVLTYLVGELWRRIGHASVARTWFDRVPDEVIDRHGQQWLLAAARQQRNSPREWFA
jgi:uncharacterized protein (DUF2225 family)